LLSGRWFPAGFRWCCISARCRQLTEALAQVEDCWWLRGSYWVAFRGSAHSRIGVRPCPRLSRVPLRPAVGRMSRRARRYRRASARLSVSLVVGAADVATANGDAIVPSPRHATLCSREGTGWARRPHAISVSVTSAPELVRELVGSRLQGATSVPNGRLPRMKFWSA